MRNILKKMSFVSLMKKKTNKQTYKKQYNYLLQSLEVCLISEVTMKTADSFSQSSTFNQESTVPEFSDWWSRTCR